jgi:hypothetical protein
VIFENFVPFSNLAPNEQKSKQKLQTSQNSAEFRQGKNKWEKIIFLKLSKKFKLCKSDRSP